MGLNIVIAVNGSPDTELSAPSWIEVVESMDEPTTYRIHYEIDIEEKDLPMLKDGRLDPESKLSILAPVGNTTYCLVMGPVRGHKIHLVHGGTGSFLEVEGVDTSIAMDRENKAAIWANLTDSDAVSAVLSPYGYTPDVESTTASHPDTKHALIQRETDFHFVQSLARRNGFLFWVTADENGVETAHFKKPSVGGAAQATLNINLDSPVFQTLDLEWDVERPTSTEAKQLDLNAKQPIDGSATQSPLANLGDKPLNAISSETRLLHLPPPADDAGDLTSRSEGALIEAGWFIRALGKTSVQETGNVVVRAHTVVEMQGLGTRHSGKYFVAGVKHTIDATAHRMELELLRNAWGA
jgi:phage protein D